MENQANRSSTNRANRYILQLADSPQAEALLAYLATLDFVALDTLLPADDLIANSNQPPLRMSAISARKGIRLGSWEGKYSIPDNFNDPV